ncbi:MAG: PH domain-containing protein [Alphaproteobacteria bacterium]|nr:PH domain-containing protein [Alphaproteobacteria bacterium]MBV8413384.1 PH domain-containing protein [Alphaproteobacteria bacterium]
MLRAVDAFLIPFSVVWGGFATFSELSAMKAGAPVFSALFGLPFVAVGLYLMVGRFFVDARQRTRTFYALTNERVLIVSGLFSRTVKSIGLPTLGEMSVSERSDGSGTIVFGTSSPFDWFAAGVAGWPGTGARLASRFEAIANVRTVFNAIRSAQKSVE